MLKGTIIKLVTISLMFLFVVSTFAFSQKKGNPVVEMKTSKGIIKIELFADKAPITVNNFLMYVNEGFFDGTIFHRVIKDFMIQGGGLNPDMSHKQTHAPIKNEANNGLSNKRGTIAMARTADIDSATSQFFINHKDNTNLDYKGEGPREFGYCVFGKVIEGMDVVDAIANVQTGSKGMYNDVPLETILIEYAKVISK
jgi:cyclophilin family peptidyl-prolyl cis-trans isomerase